MVDIELFVSLLFVVIIEIGAIARSLDLERISEEKLPPFFIGVFYLLDTSARQQQVSVPQLGRFNFLHGANLAILFLGFVLVTETTEGLTGLLIALITVIVWALLPLLEVDEYEAILIDGYRPVSYYHHVLTVLLAAGVIYGYDTLWTVLPLVPPAGMFKYLPLVVACLILYYIMLFGFLTHLERELDRTDTDRLPNKITLTDP